MGRDRGSIQEVEEGQSSGKGLKEALWEIYRVWREENFLDRRREGVIVPIAKSRGVDVVGEHRITLMPTAYKIYATILSSRLRKEIEEKKIVLETQGGFTKGKRVVDNLYVMHYVVERQLERGEKMIAAFVDFKTAFDSVDREILARCVKSVIKVEESYGKRFWTSKGVRQGCLLSSLLFNVLIVNI